MAMLVGLSSVGHSISAHTKTSSAGTPSMPVVATELLIQWIKDVRSAF